MDYYVIKCKRCGRKLLTYSKASSRKYNSPLKNCKKCGTRYADPRCHEIAIEGIPSDTFFVPSYLILSIIGALILYRGIYLFGMHQLGVPNKIQWLMPIVILVIGLIMMIGGIIEIIMIISGLKRRRFDKLSKESEERLTNKSYVYILRDLGYKIPERFL